MDGEQHHGKLRRRGFTLVQLAAVLVLLGVIAALGVVLVELSKARDLSRQSNCSANLRGIHQGFVLSAMTSDERYALPSRFDQANNTVGGEHKSKDTTAAIFSLLIYGTFFGPEICVSPAEKNPNIRVMTNFQNETPTGTINPKLALWDPAFSADFTAAGGGNLSYSHMLPSGPRLTSWSNTFNEKEAFIGNRGPLISAVTKGVSPNVTPAFDAASNTLRIHGPRASWEGNIAYNDNHVAFEESLYGPTGKAALTYKALDKAVWYDLFHYDEPDDLLKGGGMNNFLGIFTQAGPTPSAFKSIWD